MKLENYGLKIKNNILFENVNVLFANRMISHILGNNGCGKSSFGKSCVGMLKHEGTIIGNHNAILIGAVAIFQENFQLEISRNY